MVSRWRITALLSLCLVGTLACGFSSWIYSESISASTGEITVGVGDIKSSASIVYQSCSTFTYGKSGILHQDENGIEYFDYNFEIKSIWCVDTTIYSNLYYSIQQFGLIAHDGSIFNFLSSDFSNIVFSAKYSLMEDETTSRNLSYSKNTNVTEAKRATEYQIDLSSVNYDCVYLFLSYSADMSGYFADKSFEDCVYNSVSNSGNLSFDLTLKGTAKF